MCLLYPLTGITAFVRIGFLKMVIECGRYLRCGTKTIVDSTVPENSGIFSQRNGMMVFQRNGMMFFPKKWNDGFSKEMEWCLKPYPLQREHVVSVFLNHTHGMYSTVLVFNGTYGTYPRSRVTFSLRNRVMMSRYRGAVQRWVL